MLIKTAKALPHYMGSRYMVPSLIDNGFLSRMQYRVVDSEGTMVPNTANCLTWQRNGAFYWPGVQYDIAYIGNWFHVSISDRAQPLDHAEIVTR